MKEKTPQDLLWLNLYAWVGEDEFGSGEIGLKQAIVPAGMIPLVSTKDGKLDQEYIKEQLQRQANAYGKSIRLCRFGFIQEVAVIHPQKDRAECPKILVEEQADGVVVDIDPKSDDERLA